MTPIPLLTAVAALFVAAVVAGLWAVWRERRRTREVRAELPPALWYEIRKDPP